MGGTLKSLTRKLAAFSIAASFLLSVAAPTSASEEACEQVHVLAFHIEAKPDRPVYLVGEKAVIHATVTRPAHEDPAGLGIEFEPPHSEPAANINIGAALMTGDNTFLFGFAVTNDKGKADIKIDLDKSEAGMADVDIYAWNDVLRIPCLTVREYGHRYYEDMFGIV